MFDVEYYEKEDGTFPAEEFILSLDAKTQNGRKIKTDQEKQFPAGTTLKRRYRRNKYLRSKQKRRT